MSHSQLLHFLPALALIAAWAAVVLAAMLVRVLRGRAVHGRSAERDAELRYMAIAALIFTLLLVLPARAHALSWPREPKHNPPPAPCFAPPPPTHHKPTPSSDCTSATSTASWYGKPYHGRRTASGEIYNMYALTAAHATLPMNSRVRVVNLRNGRSVIVRINDRGPFAPGRDIDLSARAAELLGFKSRGLAPVRLELLDAQR